MNSKEGTVLEEETDIKAPEALNNGVDTSAEKQDGPIEDLPAPLQGEEEKIVPMHRQTKSLDETTSANNLNVPYKERRNGRRGSTCQALHKIPTIVQPLSSPEERTYLKKEDLTEEEKKGNVSIFQDFMRTEFPEEEMLDRSFRDKDKDCVVKTWILEVLGELDDNLKARNKKLQDTGELEFYLQSGIVLCSLANKIVPSLNIDTSTLQSKNLISRRLNISAFLSAAADYGVPDEYLFKPDDLATLAHVHKVTRTLYAFAELTKQDPSYTGPEFNSDQILRDLITQGIQREEDE
ncbi:uncharacterized protein LOC111711786 isoform X2 [Eurytemora carolleeae]|uniref:uncharacterized protein LOC111711786 isoform X2 n=1 Tax=Eurytemora carolleeae TaxID=1294199 RepID=UPI000C7787E9|nr:uncharacterized protein LOC111711786 isoform X2 [Eurytemora carolleeae]|eukprot:XP_023342000.1 uncharacterized protein LOC111711786 isoform X2 [Eurytemora affinis]